MANSGYRDAKGRFLPMTMKGGDAIEKNVADKYIISDNYEGKASTANARLEKPNPYWTGKFELKKEIKYPQSNEKPIFKRVDKKYENNK